MKPPIQEILKLDEAANILKCEIEDILENWSLGKIYLCINIVPPQKVIVIDDAYIQYLDDRGMDFVDVENIPETEDCNLRFEEISGPFYLMPETQKNQSRPFVKEPDRFHETGLNTLKAKILIPRKNLTN